MRGANVVRRRSVTNPGETAGATGAVNGGQADGGGSGLLAGGSAAGDPSGRRDVGGPWDRRPTAVRRIGPRPERPAGDRPGHRSATANQAPPGAPPAASMVRTTQPHPKKPGSARSRFALVNWRVRWRLAAVIAVPTLTAAVLGALTINADVNNWQATGRVQHLAQLNADTVQFSQALEDELNVSAAYAATGRTNSRAGRPAEAGAERHRQRRPRGRQRLLRRHHRGPGTSRAPCRTSTRCRRAINDLANVRKGVTGTNSCSPRRRSSGSTAGTSSRPRTRSAAPSATAPTTPTLQGNVTALGALLRNENQVSVQRAILYAALISPAGDTPSGGSHHPAAGFRAGEGGPG